jgi:hypothetical protein
MFLGESEKNVPVDITLGDKVGGCIVTSMYLYLVCWLVCVCVHIKVTMSYFRLPILCNNPIARGGL